MPKINMVNVRQMPAELGRVRYTEGLFPKKTHDEILDVLDESAAEFKPESGVRCGKEWVTEERRTAFFTDGKKDYSYAGKIRPGERFKSRKCPKLAKVVRMCVRVAKREFGVNANTAIVTRYLGKAPGQKAGELGYHADNEKGLKKSAPIVGFTFARGARREFRVRANTWKVGQPTYVLRPASGSAYAMVDMQDKTKHSIATGTDERFSVTLREIE